MDMHLSTTTHVPAEHAWALLGEQFADIGLWASVIEHSSLTGPPQVGAVRTCTVQGFGPVPSGRVEEKLLSFDPANFTFTYQAVSGLPGFMLEARNTWTVEPISPHKCRVHSLAVLRLKFPFSLVSIPLRSQLEKSGHRLLEELKHQLETGCPHPRKVKRSQGDLRQASHCP